MISQKFKILPIGVSAKNRYSKVYDFLIKKRSYNLYDIMYGIIKKLKKLVKDLKEDYNSSDIIVKI